MMKLTMNGVVLDKIKDSGIVVDALRSGSVELDYVELEDVVGLQPTNGCWKVGVLVYGGLDIERGSSMLLSKIPQELKLQDEGKTDDEGIEILSTVVGLKVLSECFKNQEKEWKLVARKDRGFLKKRAVNYD